MADADDVPVPVERGREAARSHPARRGARRRAGGPARGAGALRDHREPVAASARTCVALVPAVRDVVSRFPGGLGRPAAGVAASSALPELLAAVEPDERRVLETLAAGPPVGRSRGGADPANPVSRLLARGLLVRVDAETVELPRQVGLALRGDRPLGALALDPPDLVTVDRGVDTVDGTAAVAALRALRQVEQLVAFWGTAPPPALRSGGLGVRELRRVAREVDADETTAALLVELAVAADLVAESDGVSPGMGAHHRRPTSGLRAGPSRSGPGWPAPGSTSRGCRASSAPATTPGGRSRRCRRTAPADGSARPPSRARRARGAAAGNRRGRGGERAETPAGGQGRNPVSQDPEALADLLAWRAPRRGGRLRDEVVRWTLAEATVLGLVALDALSTPGRTLLAEPDRAAAALRAALPDPIGHVLLQADLTAVAPGPLEPGLERELGLVGEVESAGGATVYRFTEATIRRALDAGRTAAELHELFATRSATPVPQGLTYLVDDVARKHGRLRGGAAVVVPAQRRRGADRRGARLSGRRAAGAAPDRADRGGVPAAAGRADGRAARRRVHPCGRGPGRGGARPDRPRPADPAAPSHRGTARRGAGSASSCTGSCRGCAPATRWSACAAARTATARAPAGRAGRPSRLLRAAARERRSVWIGFVDGHGVAGEQVLEPDERRRRGRRGTRQRGRRAAPRPAAPDHLDRARRGLTPTSHSPSSGAASRARRAR